MTDNKKLAKLYTTQKSLTEWLEEIKHRDAATIRKEDNDKRERLKVLHQTIGLPYDQPTQFEATELHEGNKKFAAFLKEHGNEHCALRLIPKQHDLPKLRMRGKTIREAYIWFGQQNIEPSKYRADFVPHEPDNSWATIFVVNQHGIQGEIIYGGHHQLTQGFHDSVAPMVFRYDFKTWSMLPAHPDALAHLKELVTLIHVPDKAVQKTLTQKLGASFAHDYLEGYFETTDSSRGIWYKDYNQSLGKLYAEAVFRTDDVKGAAPVSGQTGSPGTATGVVRIVTPDDVDKNFPEGAVLVCPVTTPDYVPLMQNAAAVVTDQGGILSHAAIVARELKKPCIVGAGNATAVLKNGQTVTVDATTGTVT